MLGFRLDFLENKDFTAERARHQRVWTGFFRQRNFRRQEQNSVLQNRV